MIIQKSYICSPERYLKFLKENEQIFIGVSDLSRYSSKIRAVGFTKAMKVGERILPPPSFGNTSTFNSQGKQVVHKDREKENRFIRTVWWEWDQYAGYGKTEHCEDWRDIYKDCYPRTFIAPPGIELTLSALPNGEKAIISPALQWSKKNKDQVMHIINLFLEIFGEATVYNSDLETFMPTSIVRLNWKILPEGEMPWVKLKEHIKPILEKANKGDRKFITERMKHLETYKPKLCAIGEGGFMGYVVFKFETPKANVVESGFYGNATYVLGKDWKDLTKMTKKEILQQRLHEDRIIHDKKWFGNIDKLLKD